MLSNTIHSNDHSQFVKSQLLEIAAIRCDLGTQSRATINESAVHEYADAMLQGAVFPPAVVFHDGTQYVLADGFHRVFAAARQGHTFIECEIRPGTRCDALRYALGANSKHGLKRTNADKRRSVELALREWPQHSDRQIADVCAVGNALVGEVRRQLFDSNSSERRIGRDGKERRNAVRAPRESEPCSAEKASVPEMYSQVSTVSSLSEAGVLHDGITAAQVETNNDELREILSRPAAGIQQCVAYHLELARADAGLVLARIAEGSIDPDQLIAAAVEFRLATKLLEGLARRLATSSNN